METIKLTGKHIFLLFVYSPGITKDFNEPIFGKTRIVKGLFLFEKEIKKDFLKDSNIEIIKFPEFYSWKFGPFAKEIYDDIEFFINNGFLEGNFSNVEKNDVELNEEKEYEDDYMIDDNDIKGMDLQFETQFSLTEKGKEFISKKYYAILTENQKTILKKFKASISESTIPAIVRYTYLKYPNYTEQSVIKDRVFGY